MGKIKKIFTSRLVLIAISILLQVILLFLLLSRVANVIYIYYSLMLISYAMVISAVNRPIDPAIKMAWAILILAFPLFGGVLYVLFAERKIPKRLRIDNLYLSSIANENIEERESTNFDKLFSYTSKVCGFPIYKDTELKYFKLGEEKFEYLIKELKKAKHFIFMEYFIISDGFMWNTILEVLKEKVKENVEVKLLYDDFGVAAYFPKNYDKILQSYGIQAVRFNALRAELAIRMNNRDHRKICVIDNNVAFCGGINIGDEYINLKNRFGHWKDTAVMLKGKAVKSFTVMFLQMFMNSYSKYSIVDYDKYNLPCEIVKSDSLVQPYFDSPTDNENIGFNVHLELINSAKKYIYIQTPYLIIGDEMRNALCFAAKSGVDVRITTPYVPDKKYVFEITRYNYLELIKAGVKIYEYLPGFIHSKSIVCDDEITVVGTVNMDFRSYFHHFECGVISYDKEIANEVLKDQLEVFKNCTLVSVEDCLNISVFKKIYRRVLNLISPLL